MKQIHVNKFFSFSSILLLSTLLVACHAPKNTKRKILSDVKTSQTTTKKATTSSVRPASSVPQEVEAPEETLASSAEESQIPAASTAEVTTEVVETPKETTPTIPAELVGTWTGKSPQTNATKVTISSEGQIQVEACFIDDEVPQRTMTATAKAVEVSPNLYRWVLTEGDYNALLPGVYGIGGWYEAEPGFRLQNGSYTPILFTGPYGEPLDYTLYTHFHFQLTK